MTCSRRAGIPSSICAWRGIENGSFCGRLRACAAIRRWLSGHRSRYGSHVRTAVVSQAGQSEASNSYWSRKIADTENQPHPKAQEHNATDQYAVRRAGSVVLANIVDEKVWPASPPGACPFSKFQITRIIVQGCYVPRSHSRGRFSGRLTPARQAGLGGLLRLKGLPNRIGTARLRRRGGGAGLGWRSSRRLRASPSARLRRSSRRSICRGGRRLLWRMRLWRSSFFAQSVRRLGCNLPTFGTSRLAEKAVARKLSDFRRSRLTCFRGWCIRLRPLDRAAF